MSALTHILVFALSASVIWFLSGILIDAVDRVARRYNKPGFAIAFIVLGLLTSISEFSVFVNASIEGVPQISAGNLIGASLVIFLLIIPILSVAGNGIPMSRVLTPSNLLFLLCIVLLPSLVAMDGAVVVVEGLLILLLYIALMYVVQKRRPSEETAHDVIAETEHELMHTRHATVIDCMKIVIGAVLIFIAGNFLVEESIYFAKALHVPASFIGLILLSVGTNIPEIVIAIRCIIGKHKEIAFGDYMGSAAANSLLFGFLVIVNGSFAIERTEIIATFIIFLIGLALFFVFSRSKNALSRKEGIALLVVYLFFMMFQIGNAVRLSENESVDVMHQSAE